MVLGSCCDCSTKVHVSSVNFVILTCCTDYDCPDDAVGVVWVPSSCCAYGICVWLTQDTKNVCSVTVGGMLFGVRGFLHMQAHSHTHAYGGAAQLEVGYLTVSVSWPSALNCDPCNHAHGVRMLRRPYSAHPTHA